MSLLMDALRKAEEAKKQAEQERTTEDTAPEAVSAGASAPDVSEKEPEKPPSPDLSVMLEFEEDLAPVANPKAKPSLSEDLDRVIETVSLSLDASAPKRPPLNQSDGIQTADSVMSSDSSDVDSFFTAQDISSANSSAPEATLTPAIELPIELMETASQTSDSEELGVNSERTVEYSIEPEVTAGDAAPAEESKPRQNRADKNRWEDPVSDIGQRTAKGRQSAKSVFAAKKSNNKNKKAYLYGGAGVAAVVLLAGGYFLLSLGNSSNNFSIPEGTFVSTSEADFTGSNSGNIERVNADLNDTQIEPVADLGAAPINENFAGDTATEQVSAPNSNSSQIAQTDQAISTGLSITSNLATSQAPAAAPPSLAPVNNIEEIQAPATNSAAATTAPSNPSSPELQSSPITSIADVDARQDADSGNATGSNRDLISFRRKEAPDVVSPQLSNAYTAYQAGNLDSALALYDQVLANEPQNIDALLGKAAISSARGDTAQAMALYSTVLALNPSQAIARSGLLSLLPTVSPTEQERQLRRLVAEYPSVAPLAFALGNFYASQSRWVDAQKNYFNALSLAKSDNGQGTQVSPDYAFNLAISLDRLNQSGPALTYYQEALNLASQSPANFDLEIARVRINKLSGPSTL